MRVADDADVVTVTEPCIQQPLLQRVDVLVFVHDEVPVTLAHLCGDVAMLFDRVGRHHQDVLEVELTALAVDVLVGGEQLLHH